MKLVFLFTFLLLAAVLHESDAGFFRRIGRRFRTAVGRVTSGVKKVTGSVRRVLQTGVDRARDRAHATVDRISDGAKDLLGRLLRGKRSALTLNRVDDVNAVDIAKTFNLDLPGVQNVFMVCDEDGNGSLEGKEVLIFLSMIEDLASATSLQSPLKH